MLLSLIHRRGRFVLWTTRCKPRTCARVFPFSFAVPPRCGPGHHRRASPTRASKERSPPPSADHKAEPEFEKRPRLIPPRTSDAGSASNQQQRGHHGGPSPLPPSADSPALIRSARERGRLQGNGSLTPVSLDKMPDAQIPIDITGTAKGYKVRRNAGLPRRTSAFR